MVLEGLREVDDVAYLRFASVYKDFQEASDFEREMAAMENLTTLYFEVTGHAVPEAPLIVDLAGDELGWDATRKATELASYLEEIQFGMQFRENLRVSGEYQIPTQS